MAASDVSTKCRLKNVLLYVYRVRGGNGKTSIILEISVRNYFKLKENTHYNVSIKRLDCVIDVCKTRKAVTVTFFAVKDRESRIECFIIYDPDSRAQPVTANRISRREYEMHISNKIIHDSKNWLIKQGAFIFQLEISTENVLAVIRPESSTGRQSTQRRDISFEPSARLNVATRTIDDEELVCDLASLSDNEMFTDFTIYVKNTSQPLFVHKALLAARSEFFRNHIANDYSEVELDVSPDILTLVMSFLYYGKLPVTELAEILEVLQLAVTLKIKSLEDLCVNFVRDNVDGGNVQAIKETGLMFGLKKLVTIAEDFLAEYRKEN